MTRHVLPLALLAAALVSVPAQADWSGPPTPLDDRRRSVLEEIDARHRLDGEEPSFPTPNYRLRYEWHEHYYQDKAGAIFALVDMGIEPASRIDEANRLLRYEMLGRWPISSATQLEGDSGIWMHRTRTLGMRLYMLYADRMDADIAAEYRRRFDMMCRDAYTRSSENIKWTNNSSYLLAHEALGRTGTATYANVRAWVIDQLRRLGEHGFHEWGASYAAWTFTAVQNLAEFSTDEEVRRRATMVIDHTIASELGQSIRGYFSAARVRSYSHDSINGAVGALTHANQLWFGDGASHYLWTELALSNYRPLTTHQAIFDDRSAFVARSTEASGRTWTHHTARGRDFVLSVHQSVPRGHYVLPSGGTHDIVHAVVQSSGGTENVVIPYPYDPRTTFRKKRNLNQRSFAYDNVALVQNSGATQAVWAGGGIQHEIPARLYYGEGFTRTIRGGWAFLSDGRTYVAWAPGVGDPIDDPDSAILTPPHRGRIVGRWLRSTHVPDDDGEMIVLEVGDAASFGSFAAFQADVEARNPRPRVAGGVLRYVARDRTVMELGYDWAELDDVRFDAAGTPRRDTPWMQGERLTVSGATLTFDFAAGTTSGPTPRIAQSMTFGSTATTTPPAGSAHPSMGFVWGQSGSSVSGWAYDPESPETFIAVVVIASPTHAEPTRVGTLIADGEADPTRDAAIREYIAARTDPAPAGYRFVWGADLAALLPTFEGVTEPGTYVVQLVVLDRQDPGGDRVLATFPAGEDEFTIEVTERGNAAPLPPERLFVSSTVAQLGTEGDPVEGIDLSPAFSAIYRDPDLDDVATRYFIQVSTDPTFEEVDTWSSGVTALAAPCANGSRCADMPYGGEPLAADARYYWRMIFIDDGGAWGDVHATPASFVTRVEGGHAPDAPAMLFVGSDEAQSGAPSRADAPVYDVDRDPVFSAVFSDPDPLDRATGARIQVATDPSFVELAWDSGPEPLAIAPVPNGARSEDIAFGAEPLDPNTLYYWRMLFVDESGLAGFPSETGAFTTRVDGDVQPLAIDAASLPVAVEGDAYVQPFEARGGVVPYTWSIAGELPEGIAFDAAEGGLFGTPEAGAAGDYPLTVVVTDRRGERATAALLLEVRTEATLTSGCGCRAAGEGAGSGALWLLIGLLGLALRRRRARSSSVGLALLALVVALPGCVGTLVDEAPPADAAVLDDAATTPRDDAGTIARPDGGPITAPDGAPPVGDDGGAPIADSGPACPAGQTNCGGACVDVTSDAAHCGRCGQACAPGGACVGGHCEGGVGCPPAPADVSPDAAAALERTNEVRSAMGVPCMGMSLEINLAAERHCAYYEANRGDATCTSNAHREVVGCDMFVAERFDGRMRAAGYTGSPRSENMHFVGNGAAAVQGWIDSVYHRNPVLQPWIGEMGHGTVGRCDTADYGGGSGAPYDMVVTYPYPGQASVPTAFSGAEGPPPPAPPTGWPSGYPITIYMYGEVTTHRLIDTSTGADVDHVWLYPAHPDTYTLLREEFVMYANDPLSSATTYRVVIEGSTSSGPVSLDFTFTTR